MKPSTRDEIKGTSHEVKGNPAGRGRACSMRTRGFPGRVPNSLRMEEQSHTLSVRMVWITSGFSPSTALRAGRLRTSIPSKSCRFTGHRMAKILVYCAATPIPMLYSCKSPNRRPCIKISSRSGKTPTSTSPS
jgi:hypothetical protein